MGRLQEAVSDAVRLPKAGKQMKGIIRTLAVPLFAVSPFVLILGIGVSTKTWSPSKSTLYQYSSHEDNLVANYAEVVKLAEKNITGFGVPLKGTREVLSLWARKFKAGKLGPMSPAFQEESSEQGPRTEILTAWVHATNNGFRLVNQDFKMGRFHQWQKDASLLVATLESFKYSDTNTVIGADRMESSLLNQMNGLMKRKGLESGIMHNLKQVANDMRPRETSFQALSKTLSKNAADYIARQKEILARGGSSDLDEGVTIANEDSMLDDLRTDTFQEAMLAGFSQKTLGLNINHTVGDSMVRTPEGSQLAVQFIQKGILDHLKVSLI